MTKEETAAVINRSPHTDGNHTICFVTQEVFNSIWNTIPPILRCFDRECAAGKRGFTVITLGPVSFMPIVRDGAAKIRELGYWSTYIPEPEKSKLAEFITTHRCELWIGSEIPDTITCGARAFRVVSLDHDLVNSNLKIEQDEGIPDGSVFLRYTPNQRDPRHNRMLDIERFL
jgi:hypothetical protein